MFVIINHCENNPSFLFCIFICKYVSCPLMAHNKKSVTSQKKKKNIPKAITKETLGVMTIKITVTMAGSVEDK